MHIQTSLPENCICCLYFTLCQLIVSKLCAQQQDCSAGVNCTTSSHRHLGAWLLLNCHLLGRRKKFLQQQLHSTIVEFLVWTTACVSPNSPGENGRQQILSHQCFRSVCDMSTSLYHFPHLFCTLSQADIALTRVLCLQPAGCVT